MECGKHVMLIFCVISLTLRMVETKDHKIILESGYNLQVMFLFIFISITSVIMIPVSIPLSISIPIPITIYGDFELADMKIYKYGDAD